MEKVSTDNSLLNKKCDFSPSVLLDIFSLTIVNCRQALKANLDFFFTKLFQMKYDQT